MSQLTKIAESEDKSDLSSVLFKHGVILDIDCSGSITDDELKSFINELSAINDVAAKKDRWLNFSHKIRNKGKEMKPRVYSKKTANRFKLSKVTQRFEFMFTDGEV